jgi:glutamate-ammonia-ligase adenylyltransferase
MPPSPHAGTALERLSEAAEAQGEGARLAALRADPATSAFLDSALGDSPFLLELAAKDVARLAAVLEEAPETRIERQNSVLAETSWEARPDAMGGLRQARQNVALTLALADLARAVPLETVTRSLTAFADRALDAALRFALAEAARSGKTDGAARGFFLLAMGKYGADELNYSSDIDLLALFEPDAPGLAAGVEPGRFWVQIVRMLVALMQERTADGYVFRTDLRLRPDPAATPLAISAPAALGYYESMGQNWERAALIKARPAAGDLAAGAAFVKELAPFIWRKHLDFAAIADIHSIKRQVHAHRGHDEVRVLGHDIKRGRGGIREIEFFVQTQQLIAGGRDRTLRGSQTRPMLAKLAERGWIDEAARHDLDEAYVFLRMVEHRLQMVRDEQTHRLPAERGELARIGRMMGYADAAAFEQAMRRVLETVTRRSGELFKEAPELAAEAGSLVFTGGDDDPETLETLARLGYAEPRQVTDTVRGWHFGRFAAMRSTAAREGLTEITPDLLAALARAGNPDAALKAFDSLLKALPAGAQLFALLDNNRELLDMLATILGAAPRLAEVFARRPQVADALIDPAPIAGSPNADDLEALLEARLPDAASYEDVLNRARAFAAEQRFLISVGLLRGAFDAARAGRSFSDLAEAIVRLLFRHTCAEFERQHGKVPGGEAAVLAFGRLGSREMTAGSDLDLIVLYDHATDAAASDGKRPLAPSQYYARLTQRLTAALSAPTSEGIAYAVDLRLRPSGMKGPLATHIEAFEHYQLNEAWTWEHMAMSRGRTIAGDPALSARVAKTLDDIAAKSRDRAALAADIAAMRGRIEREKTAANSFDVKLAPGGLIDCEFAAQFMMLSGLGRVAGETAGETLRRGADRAFMTNEVGRPLIAAATLQTAILQVLRVAGDRTFDPRQAPDALKRILVTTADSALARTTGAGSAVGSFEALQARLERVQSAARAALEMLLGVPAG